MTQTIPSQKRCIIESTFSRVSVGRFGLNSSDTTYLIRCCLPKDGPGTGFNYIAGVAAFDDDSVLLAGFTEGNWAIDNVGGRDFALAKLNASGHLEWSWQVTKGRCFSDSVYEFHSLCSKS